MVYLLWNVDNEKFLHDGFRNLPVKSKYIITVIACLKLVTVPLSLPKKCC